MRRGTNSSPAPLQATAAGLRFAPRFSKPSDGRPPDCCDRQRARARGTEALGREHIPNTEGWDSFANLNVIAEIERRFELEVTLEVAVELQSVAGWRRYLRGLGRI